MAYVKKDWTDGEVITETAMDNIESGIAANDTKNTEQDTQIQELKAVATASKNGLMSAADKSKLDGIAAQANKYTLPNATTSSYGGVKQAANVAKVVGEAPTKAEFDALIDSLVAAGIMAGA